jgi:hypothetical protein
MPEIFITWGPGSNYWGTNVHQKIASHFLVSLNPFSAGLVIFDLKVKKKKISYPNVLVLLPISLKSVN